MSFYIAFDSSQWLKVGSEVDCEASCPVSRREQSQEVGRAEVRAGSGVDFRIEAFVIRPRLEISAGQAERHCVTERPRH